MKKSAWATFETWPMCACGVVCGGHKQVVCIGGHWYYRVVAPSGRILVQPSEIDAAEGQRLFALARNRYPVRGW